jgi:hypothetical protein
MVLGYNMLKRKSIYIEISIGKCFWVVLSNRYTDNTSMLLLAVAVVEITQPSGY